MQVSFVTETALPVHRTTFGAVGFVLCASAIAVLAWPAFPLPSSLRAIVGAIVLTLPANGAAAYLLEAQFRLLRRPSLCVLGAAFWFSGLMSIAYVLALPSQGEEPVIYGAAGDQVASWLWVIWRFGFILFMAAFLLLDRVIPIKLASPQLVAAGRYLVGIGLPLLVAVVAFTINAKQGALTPVIQEGQFNPRFALVVGYPALIFHVALLLIFVLITRLKTLSDLALSFALLAWLLGDLLTIASAARFTLGWYIGLIDYIASSFAVPLAFLMRLHSLYYQVDQLNQSLSALALLDGLTGLANRRQFDQRLASEWAAAMRRRETMALVMADIDWFKRYNDHYGHVAGDEYLRDAARALRQCATRALDLAARYGGEEFAVILPATELEGAWVVAERIRQVILELAAAHHPDRIAAGFGTMSLGVAAWSPAPGQSPEMLTEAADRALYQAKQQGRNQVVTAPVLTAPVTVP
jgi:diguanylate cyclase (GGDEF)-like protein